MGRAHRNGPSSRLLAASAALALLLAGAAGAQERPPADRSVALQHQMAGRWDAAIDVWDAIVAAADGADDPETAAEARYLRAQCLQQAGRFADAMAAFERVAAGHADTRWAPLARTQVDRLRPHAADGFAALAARDRALRAVYVAEPDPVEVAAAREALAAVLAQRPPPGDQAAELAALIAECELRLRRWSDAAGSFERAAALASETARPAFEAKADLARRYVARRWLGIAGLVLALLLAPVPFALAPRGAFGGGRWRRPVGLSVALWVGLGLVCAFAARAGGVDHDIAYPMDHRHVAAFFAAVGPAVVLTALLGLALGRRAAPERPEASLGATAAYGAAAVGAASLAFLWLADLFPALGLSPRTLPH